jgi:hypothetical protein
VWLYRLCDALLIGRNDLTEVIGDDQPGLVLAAGIDSPCTLGSIRAAERKQIASGAARRCKKKPGQGQIDRALDFSKAPSRAGPRCSLLLASCGVFNVDAVRQQLALSVPGP